MPARRRLERPILGVIATQLPVAKRARTTGRRPHETAARRDSDRALNQLVELAARGVGATRLSIMLYPETLDFQGESGPERRLWLGQVP